LFIFFDIILFRGRANLVSYSFFFLLFPLRFAFLCVLFLLLVSLLFSNFENVNYAHMPLRAVIEASTTDPVRSYLVLYDRQKKWKERRRTTGLLTFSSPAVSLVATFSHSGESSSQLSFSSWCHTMR
jgi:hypothetical protein